MNPGAWPGGLAYIGIFIAAAIEGEVIFIAAAILVGMGRLSAPGVMIAGALGGSAGDQFFFYALRATGWKSLSRLTKRIPRHEPAMQRINRHSSALILACRFLPGLRIAIPAACSCAGVSALRFSILSLAGSFVWAATILFVVARAGSSFISMSGLWGAFLPAILVLGFAYWLGRSSKNYLERPAEMDSQAG